MQLPVFVALVLQHFFYCDLLTRASHVAEVHGSESALASHSIDLVLIVETCRRLVSLLAVDLGGFSFEVLEEIRLLMRVDFEGFAGVGRVLQIDFGIDIQIFLLRVVALGDPIGELCAAIRQWFIDFGLYPPRGLFAGPSGRYFWVRFIRNH